MKPYAKKSYAGKRAPYKKRATKSNAKGKQLVTKNQLYRAIRRNVETKRHSVVSGVVAYNSSIIVAGDFTRVLPLITSGVGQNQRIGAKIKPLSLTIRGHIAYNTNINSNIDQAARMIVGRMFIVSQKSARCYDVPLSNFKLLDTGNGGSEFIGVASQTYYPLNTDEFVFHAHKKFVCQKPFGATNLVSPTAANSITSFNSSMFRPFLIKLTQKQLPAILQYDDSTSNPINFAPYIALGYADVFGAAADSLTQQLTMNYTATLEYEDA